MSGMSENECTESTAQNNEVKVFTVMQPLRVDYTCRSSSKRKWDDVKSSTLNCNLKLAGQCTSEENLNLTFAADYCNVGKIHAAVQCPESSVSAKRIRTINKKELNALRIQIAMISDGDGDRPIHVAVAQENLKLVRKLCALMLKAAISLDLTNYLRQTPLHLAVMLGNTDMVSLLLKCGASMLLRDRNGNSVIHLAVKTNVKKNMLDLILSHPDAKTILNSLDHEGYSALHYAVLKNNKTAAKCLHSVGAWVNIIDGKSGRSPLMYAVLELNGEMVSLLLEGGASAEVTDYSGRSVFELALQSSNKQIVKQLEKHLFVDAFTEVISREDSKYKGTAPHSTTRRTRSERSHGNIKTSTSNQKEITLDRT